MRVCVRVCACLGFQHFTTNREAHDDVIKSKHFPRYWPFVRVIHPWPVNSPHKGQWRGAFMFSLICAWINAWVNDRKDGDLRRHRVYNDVIVMIAWAILSCSWINIYTWILCYFTCDFGVITFQHITDKHRIDWMLSFGWKVFVYIMENCSVNSPLRWRYQLPYPVIRNQSVYLR